MRTSVTLWASDFARVHLIPTAAPIEHPIVSTGSGRGGVSLQVDDTEKAREFAAAILRACDLRDAKPMPPRSLAPYALDVGGVARW